MKKIDLGQTITILANVGVIAGIAFLGIELRQNNELMAAQARLIELQNRATAWSTLIDEPAVITLLVKDREGAELTTEEEFRLSAYWMRNLELREWDYLEIPENTKWANPMGRNFAAYGSLRRAWEGDRRGAQSAGKDNFDPEFIQFIETEVIPGR